MKVTVSSSDAHAGGVAATDDLHRWRQRDPRLRGRLVRHPAGPPPPGTLGGAGESLTLLSAPGGLTAALAAAVVGWLQNRRGDQTVTITLPDQPQITVVSTKVRGLTARATGDLAQRIAAAMEESGRTSDSPPQLGISDSPPRPSPDRTTAPDSQSQPSTPDSPHHPSPSHPAPPPRPTAPGGQLRRSGHRPGGRPPATYQCSRCPPPAPCPSKRLPPRLGPRCRPPVQRRRTRPGRRAGPPRPGDLRRMPRVLVIDQLEEIFTHCRGTKERRLFTRALNGSPHPGARGASSACAPTTSARACRIPASTPSRAPASSPLR
ncbi:hypothetical protein [Streptomyces sp. NPDC005890]|uniref:effector-associated constant component EACC1 n=1 Tax=Streptomyces sp. NPDC005890 TaxID=3154568 RepID=UPI0033F3BDEE